MGFGLILINAVVGIVTFGLVPWGGAVGHDVSCGAPICSTSAFVEKDTDATEISIITRDIIANILFLFDCIFISSYFYWRKKSHI
jgi:hypothetical protein